MGQQLGKHANGTYLQRVEMRLLDSIILQEYPAVLVAFQPIPIYGPQQKPCLALVPLSTLRDIILAHLEQVRQARPLSPLSAYAMRSCDTNGLLLVLRLCNVPLYGEIDCFEGTLRIDPLSGNLYVPSDELPRLSWWTQTCAAISHFVSQTDNSLQQSEPFASLIHTEKPSKESH